MNNGSLNGFGLDATINGGENLTETGGITCDSILSSLLISSAILVGGMFSVSDAEGQIPTVLQGNIGSTSGVGGSFAITIVLQGGITEQHSVGGVLDFAPSLRGGIKVNPSVGGQLKTHVLLQTSQLGQRSVTSGEPIRADTALNGGVYGTGYITSYLVSDTVLLADGVKSDSIIDSVDMELGASLDDGVSSTSSVGGSLKYPCYLRGGVLWTDLVGKEIDIDALLQDGIQYLNSMGGTLKISPVGNGGINSSATFSARQQLSPAANGGVASSAYLDSKFNISDRLFGGLTSVNILGGKGITASQILRGGITPAAGNSLSGSLKANAKLQGAVTSHSIVGGDIVQGFLDPLLNTSALEIRSATVLLEVLHASLDT